MSRLSKLIAELCPNGVEYKKLGEVAEILTGGEPPENAVKGKVPAGNCIYPIYANGIGENALWGFSEKATVNRAAVTFSSIGTIGHPTIRKSGFTPIIRLKVIYPKNESILNLRFLKYALEVTEFKQQKSSLPNINASMVKAILIPLPPLAIQSEIVKILDNFAELTAELTAELEKRKKQYEHYRDMLLNFTGGGRYDNISQNEPCPSVEWKRLGEIAEIMRGKRLTKSDLSDDNPFPVFHGGLLPLGYYSQSNRDKDTVMIINVGASAGTVGYCKEQFWASDGCFCLSKNDIALSKYLYYVLQSKELEIKGKVRVAGIPTLDSQAVASISIPLPSLTEQERIVAILDRFDSLCNSLTEGLPAEIELRKKQYEYYRDKLLSFGRASSSRNSREASNSSSSSLEPLEH